jgi:hypothetical protein
MDTGGAQPHPQGAHRHEPASASGPRASETSRGGGDIFLSYRREDSAGATGRIYDRLVAHFGRDRVFKDVDAIPLGVDFLEYLSQRVGDCGLLIAVIGDRWLEGASPGQSRLDAPEDFVRIEIEAALARSIPVVPVLVRGATMPTPAALPESIAAFAYRNGIMVRADPDFHKDMDRLIAGIADRIV